MLLYFRFYITLLSPCIFACSLVTYNSREKPRDTLHLTYYMHLTFTPLLTQTMLVFGRCICNNGEIAHAQQHQMSRRRKNIVLGGVGVRVWCMDEEVKKNMVFYHFFVSVQGILAIIVYLENSPSLFNPHNI